MSITEHTKDRVKLQKEVKYFFRKKGWSIIQQPPNMQLRVLRPKYDFAIAKGDLFILITFVDKILRRFFGSCDIAEKFDSVRRELRAAANVPLVFINRSGFEDFSTAELAKSGVIMFSSLELTRLSNLDIYPDKPPSELELRIALIYQQNMKYCLSVSESCLVKNNLPDAIEWARLPTAGIQKAPSAHMRLFQLLMRAKQFDDAEALAQELIVRQPRNINLLSKMKMLAANRGDAESADFWATRLAAARDSSAGSPDTTNRWANRIFNISTIEGAEFLQPERRSRFWFKKFF